MTHQRRAQSLCVILVAFIFSALPLLAQERILSGNRPSPLSLQNDQVLCTIRTEGNKFLGDRLEVRRSRAQRIGGSSASIASDSDFNIDLMFTDSDAPGKPNNAENLKGGIRAAGGCRDQEEPEAR